MAYLGSEPILVCTLYSKGLMENTKKEAYYAWMVISGWAITMYLIIDCYL